MNDPLTLAQADGIALAIVQRQERFAGEELHTSVMVVLLNYGEDQVPVACIGGEWSGVKADLQPGPSIPHCPNGHVLTETSTRPQTLGVVEARPL